MTVRAGWRPSGDGCAPARTSAAFTATAATNAASRDTAPAFISVDVVEAGQKRLPGGRADAPAGRHDHTRFLWAGTEKRDRRRRQGNRSWQGTSLRFLGRSSAGPPRPVGKWAALGCARQRLGRDSIIEGSGPDRWNEPCARCICAAPQFSRHQSVSRGRRPGHPGRAMAGPARSSSRASIFGTLFSPRRRGRCSSGRIGDALGGGLAGTNRRCPRFGSLTGRGAPLRPSTAPGWPGCLSRPARSASSPHAGSLDQLARRLPRRARAPRLLPPRVGANAPHRDARRRSGAPA